ncbi:MAG: aliphatic sulfonate ABC transporter substrate-binding protein [Burkholderiaceae bacterium]|nr:aliphatic sulfonate ABC transporter substrate-binding protein [Burkholderiaceae bacterium]
MKIHGKVLGLVVTGVFSIMPFSASAENPKEIRVDYTSYSPTSLVVRKMGWMEEEFKKDNIPVKWVYSPSSSNALDFLKKGSLDFGSAAGLSGVMARSNGAPLKAVYVFSKPEWVAMMVGKNSTITNVKELKGKKIAATPGTDAYSFMLRTLHLNGMSKADVNVVPLAHVLGRKALENNEVDAWIALDPHQAASELEAGSKALYRNPDFSSFGLLYANESFISSHPDIVKRVVKAYEKARTWAIANPEETAKLLAEEAKISLPVAKAQLKRNDFSNPTPGPAHVKVLKAGISVLVQEKLVPSEDAGNKAIDELITSDFMK